MDFIEKTGKTVEDALNDALAELKTTADKVNVEVIEERYFWFICQKSQNKSYLKRCCQKNR